jgi:hypothetical protein
MCISINVLYWLLVFQIERWWKELHKRLEKYFKEKLNILKDSGEYNPHDETDRYFVTVFNNAAILNNWRS